MLLIVESALLTSTYTAEERDADGLSPKPEMEDIISVGGAR